MYVCFTYNEFRILKFEIQNLETCKLMERDKVHSAWGSQVILYRELVTGIKRHSWNECAEGGSLGHLVNRVHPLNSSGPETPSVWLLCFMWMLLPLPEGSSQMDVSDLTICSHLNQNKEQVQYMPFTFLNSFSDHTSHSSPDTHSLMIIFKILSL